MATNAGNDPSPGGIVVDESSEDVVAVDRRAEGPVLPVRFNEIAKSSLEMLGNQLQDQKMRTVYLGDR